MVQPFQCFETTYFDHSLPLINRLISILISHNQLLDGWEALDAIRHIKPLLHHEIPIYIISTSVRPIDCSRALAYPFVQNFFFKPVTTTQIREVEKYLNNLSYLLN